MQLDTAMLQTVESEPTPAVRWRFYRWDRPTVSIGRHQAPESAFNLDRCRAAGIPWVRRPTGGRAVLHADELTYAVASNDPTLLASGIQACYAWVAQVLLDALRDLDVGAIVVDKRPTTSPLRDSGRKLPCFISMSRNEIAWADRKLVGSAQRRTRRAFLQHGSIPIRIDYDLMASCLNTTVGELQRLVTSLDEAAGRGVQFAELARALTRSIEKSQKGVVL